MGGEARMSEQFHHYTIIQDLAKKYSHSTYLAAPIDEPERQVVLIVFSSQLFSSSLERAEVLKNVQFFKKLQHPHLVPFLDLGIADKQPFVVREYVPHQSLRSSLKQLAPERLELRDALSLLLQVGEALVYAHSHGIVHGNLKPENILLDAGGRALVTDFDLLNKRRDIIVRDQITEEYAFCYLAPEQFAGTWDACADQYALGCLCYELITGEVPFATKGLVSLIKDHSYYVPPASLSEKVPHLPTSLDAAVLKALAKNPSDRFGNLSLFLEEIRAVASPPPAFPLARSKTTNQPKPYSRLAQPPKAPEAWDSTCEEVTSDHSLSHRLRASSGVDVKDPFAEMQQEDDLGAWIPVSEGNDSEIAFAHDKVTEVWSLDVDDPSSGQTMGQSGLSLKTMQSPLHFPRRKQPRIKGYLIWVLLLTGTALLILLFSSPSLGLISVAKTWEKTQTSSVPIWLGQQKNVSSQILQNTPTPQLITTSTLDLPSHSVSSASSSSSSSKSEPVVTPSATPTASLLPTATPTPPSPSGYWKFDEGGGTVVQDYSGNDYKGTLEGHATWSAPGKVGPYALSLDGSSSTDVDIPATVVDTTKSYTFAAWVLLTNNSTGKAYTAISIDGNQISGEYLGFSNLYFCLRTTSADSTSPNNWYTACTNYTPNTNQWYHLAGVYNATAQTIALYVNGSLVQSTADPSAWKASGHTGIGRGKYQGNPVDFWPGLIDDVHIYQTALSASDIQALAQ